MNDIQVQYLLGMLEHQNALIERIVGVLEKVVVQQFKIDGQVARPATTDDLEKGKPITADDIRVTYEAMMKQLRPIHRDAVQKAMLDAQAKHPGVKMSEWPAKARADLLRALKCIDPLDDEIPF